MNYKVNGFFFKVGDEVSLNGKMYKITFIDSFNFKAGLVSGKSHCSEYLDKLIPQLIWDSPLYKAMREE